MWLGIALGVLLLAIAAIVIGKHDSNNTAPAGPTEHTFALLWVFALIIGVPALCCYASGLPLPDSAKYEVTIEGQIILFDNYQLSGDEITIPSHYYRKRSWINSWEYTNAPLVIVSSTGNCKLPIGERYIPNPCGDIQTSYPDLPKPYILSGAIDK